MTFGRWLLVHSFSISILIMLGIGYVYKEELRLSQAYKQLLQVEPEKIIQAEKDSRIESQTKAKQSVEKSKLADEIATNTIVENETTEDRSLIELEVVGTMSGSEDAQSNKVTFIDEKKAREIEESIHLAKIPSKNPQKVEEKLNKVEAPIKERKAPSVLSSQELVAKARQAYWDKNYPLSIDLYQKAIQVSPNQADLFGELGNVFYGLKNIDTASKYYLRSGEIFLESKQDERAKEVYDILQKISPSTAQQLLNKKQQYSEKS